LTGIALAIELIVGGSAFALRNDLEPIVTGGLNRTFASMINDTEDRKSWDVIQEKVYKKQYS